MAVAEGGNRAEMGGRKSEAKQKSGNSMGLFLSAKLKYLDILLAS